MSWLAKSLANSLMPDHRDGGGSGGRYDDEEEHQYPLRRSEPKSTDSHHSRRGGDGGEEVDEDPSRGVKEDLSELTQTLTRQFWGVASFLAPPPHSSDAGTAADRPAPSAAPRDYEPKEGLDTPSIAGIRSDFAEIGGRFRSGISKLSSNKAVTEISKIASTFLPFGSEEDEDEYEEEEEGSLMRSGGIGAIGVTEEVMAFVRNISMHPETWLDFPLLSDDEESDDFDMSDAQQEHAYAVESLTPRLAALRIELCPTHMSEGCFWKIYFVLLHPRLNKHDAELLSTPQIVEARSLLQQKLQKKSERERLITEMSYRKPDDTTFQPQEQITTAKDLYVISPSRKQEAIASDSAVFEMEKHPVSSTEVEIVDKTVIEEDLHKQLQTDHSNALNISIDQFDEEGDDDWLEESADIGTSATITIPLDNDEDVSFSDLEEECDNIPPKSMKR